jgi:hypothetical protein
MTSYTFAGVTVHNLLKHPKFTELTGFNPRKYFIGKVLTYKYGLGILMPIALVLFKDFL